MLHVVSAELRKLRRPTLLYSTILIVIVLTGLLTSIVFLRVESGRGWGSSGRSNHERNVKSGTGACLWI